MEIQKRMIISNKLPIMLRYIVFFYFTKSSFKVGVLALFLMHKIPYNQLLSVNTFLIE